MWHVDKSGTTQAKKTLRRARKKTGKGDHLLVGQYSDDVTSFIGRKNYKEN